MAQFRTKTYEFLDTRDKSVLQVEIREVMEADYGLYTWPSAIILAQFIIHRKSRLMNKTVLELGAGTALSGLVAARCGAASVTLTDHAANHQTLSNCRDTVAVLNLPHVNVCGLTWGHFTSELIRLRGVDLILAADCFYDTKDFEPVLVTVAYLLESSTSAEFWCTYQVRSADRSLEHMLEKWSLRCEQISLGEFVDEISVVCRESPHDPPAHEIQMLIISSNIQCSSD